MMSRLLLIACFVLAACAALHAAPTVFYVAPAGNDAWTGRLAVPNAAKSDGPFATLTRAREAIFNLKAKGPLTGPVTIQLRGGKYCLDQTFTLDAHAGGAKDAPVTFASYPGEKPEIIGGRLISGFKPVGGG